MGLRATASPDTAPCHLPVSLLLANPHPLRAFPVYDQSTMAAVEAANGKSYSSPAAVNRDPRPNTNGELQSWTGRTRCRAARLSGIPPHGNGSLPPKSPEIGQQHHWRRSEMILVVQMSCVSGGNPSDSLPRPGSLPGLAACSSARLSDSCQVATASVWAAVSYRCSRTRHGGISAEHVQLYARGRDCR